MVTTARSAVIACASCGKRNRVPLAAGRARCAECHAFLPLLMTGSDDTFDELVTGSTVPVLVDVWAPWCGPCRAVAPIVEGLAAEHAGKLKVVKVNADEASQVAGRHRVTSIPTLLMYRDGKEAARTVGAPPADQLRRWVDEAMAA